MCNTEFLFICKKHEYLLSADYRCQTLYEEIEMYGYLKWHGARQLKT